MSWSAKRWRRKAKLDGKDPDFCEFCFPSPTLETRSNQTILPACHRNRHLKLERRLHVTLVRGTDPDGLSPTPGQASAPRLLEGRRGHWHDNLYLLRWRGMALGSPLAVDGGGRERLQGTSASGV